MPVSTTTAPATSDSATSVLLVEDDRAIQDALVYALQREGYRVCACTTGAAALALARKQHFALAVLDVGLPDQTGFELLRALQHIQVLPALFLTARSEEVDRIVGLELGAEDYVSKPFSPRELLLRIKVILRRHAAMANTTSAATQVGELSHDQLRAEVCCGARPLALTRAEYLLLTTLMTQPGRVWSREQLLQALGPASEDSSDRAIDTLVKQVRAKLREHTPQEYLHTHRGLGYSLRPGDAP